MKRAKHSLSHYKLVTCDMGQLIPIGCFEVLPGDTVQQATAALIRVSPLVAPVMHPVSVRIHHWYVPHRLVWNGWEEFITGGPDGLGGSAGAFPVITAGGGGFGAGDLPDYLGIKPGVGSLAVSALPFRSYALIFNEWYRDEDLVTPLVVNKGSGADATTPLVVQKVAWEKDYFTSARPWPQKGPAVTLPLGSTAPVRGIGPANAGTPAAGAGVAIKESGGTVATPVGQWSSNTQTFYLGATATGSGGSPTIYADLANATAANVNDIRRAFALQRYQEARAMYGSRYTEYLRYLGVRSSDARLQRPEYLGGGKQTIAFSEVLQTGPDSTDEGVANIKGHGIAAMRSRRYRRFFEEHGLVMSLMSVRPRTMYVDATERMWSRRTKEDFWQKELEHIGQQQVQRREVYAEAGAGGDTVFGYQDRYADYRHIQSGVTGEFRTLLNYWHLGRSFASAPALNASFVTCDPSKRIHAVETNDVLWCMVSQSIQARRLVSRSSVGRIL